MARFHAKSGHTLRVTGSAGGGVASGTSEVRRPRTPTVKRWAAEWMAKEPFELESRPVELQFEIMHSSPRSTSGVS